MRSFGIFVYYDLLCLMESGAVSSLASIREEGMVGVAGLFSLREPAHRAVAMRFSWVIFQA
jgi:hypothetical protein